LFNLTEERNKIMKKAYLAPALGVDTMEEEQSMMAVSFKETLDDKNSVAAGDILGREDSSVWDDEE
jgi:hypothetical protein